MKSLVCLAELAVVILCYVYNGVASEERGKYEKKRGTRATQDTCDDSQSKLLRKLARQELRSKGNERGSQ